MSLWVPDLTYGFLIQNNVIRTRITSLYVSQLSSVVFAGKTATFESELKVSMVPRHNLSFCAFKTTWLASELLVSMGPSPHFWFLQEKQRLKDRNFKSLWVPALICCFCMQNSEFWIRTTSLYGFQTSPVDLLMQKGVLRSRMTLVYWSQPSSVVLRIQNGDFSITNTSLYWSQPSFVAIAC